MRKPKKKKRKHNQLGLTPKTEEHESSEEEDDVDDEARLGQGKISGPLQFTYKGRTSTLQSPEEIAAWIEERKKRFPTQARVEEKKKAIEEAKKARNEALKEKERQKEEARRQKEARAQKERDKLERKEQREQSTDPVDAAMRAKLKAERLRRKLIKEEKRVARAEADAERARLRAEALQQASVSAGDAKIGDPGQETAQDSQATPTANPLIDKGHQKVIEEKSVQVPQDGPSIHKEPGEPPNGIPSTSDAAITTVVEEATTGEAHGMVDGHIPASSDVSDTSDWTSSSGSDLSSSESEDSDSDSAPEEVSSRREGPERVAPPPREVKKKLCRHFARSGRCSRGDKCKFLHEKPDPSVKKPGERKSREKPGRKGLLQAVSDALVPSYRSRYSWMTDCLSSFWRARGRTRIEGSCRRLCCWARTGCWMNPPRRNRVQRRDPSLRPSLRRRRTMRWTLERLARRLLLQLWEKRHLRDLCVGKTERMVPRGLHLVPVVRAWRLYPWHT